MSLGFFFRQLVNIPPWPTTALTGQVFIVTGSNIGLGFEAAKHLVRLDAAKVVLAVRAESTGEEAAQKIASATNRPGVTEVWPLELGSYESIKAFIRRMDSMPRLDGLLLNAGVATGWWSFAESDETGITVNVISTMLLATAGIQILEKSSKKYNVEPRVTVVSSAASNWAEFAERAAPRILDALNDQDKSKIGERYPVTKLLEIFAVRELTQRYNEASRGKPTVTINMLSPGFCWSALGRSLTGIAAARVWVMRTVFARTTEQGGRTLVHGVTAGPETHGHYLSASRINEHEPPAWTRTQEGREVQKRLWGELTERFERISPGVTAFLSSE